MERRTTIAVAGGITLTVAAAVAAVGLNLGLMSNRTPTTGPGTFEPIAAEVTTIPASPVEPASPVDPAITDIPAVPATTPTTGDERTAVDPGPDGSVQPDGSWGDGPTGEPYVDDDDGGDGDQSREGRVGESHEREGLVSEHDDESGRDDDD